MAGEAKSDVFMLGTATVMIGPMKDVFDLTPADHSIGLVKSVTVTSEPTFTDLSQGVKNSLVYSTMTGNPVRVSMEAYEYTSKNIAYSMGLEGGKASPVEVVTTLGAAIAAAATKVTLTSATGLKAGDWIIIGEGDDLVVRQITALTALEATVKAIPKAVANGAKVRLVANVAIGSKDDLPFFGMKIVGVTANGSPITMILPKIRITNGFSLAFTTDDYGNLPIEATVFDLVSTDALYAEFANRQGSLFSTR